MSRKKIILISLLAITVIVSSFVAFHFFSNDSSSKVDTSKQLKTNLKEKEKKDKTDNKETEKEETNSEKTTPQTNETEKQNIEETPKENPNNNVNTPQPQTPSNNQTTTKQPTTPPKVVETPSCTPKLFYVVFRADFDSLDKLKATAEQYKEIYGFTGYEYMSATDDCGDTYYQLTMRTKDDKLVEYSDIPKP